MADFNSGTKDSSNRHLRFKLQSLGRRLDELEEATKNLQKAEDEVLDLQDKIIQAEGSNSSMLADVELLRKRVLKIEGKDEEIQKAEDLCRLTKEKLEEEECATATLKAQIENLQKRMTELEKLEEAFSKSKNECTQLCLSLNEEKNVSKKLFADLESLKVKIKEMEASEGKLDKTEQHFSTELEKIKSFTLIFVNERKQLLDRERQNEKLIQDLKQKLERNNQINLANQTRNASYFKEQSTQSNSERSDLRIEDDRSKLPAKESKRKSSLDYVKLLENDTITIPENEKNKNQEDNKVKELNQEIEKLRTQLNHLKSIEEELKQMNEKNNALHDNYLSEQSKNKLITEQLEKLTAEIKNRKDLENGMAGNDEIASAERFSNEKNKCKSEISGSKYKSREHSPPLRRERVQNRDIGQCYDSVPHSYRPAPNTSVSSRRGASMISSTSPTDRGIEDQRRAEYKPNLSSNKDVMSSLSNEVKKSKEQPSVLSRYPPAAQESNTPRPWKVYPKPLSEGGMKNRTQKTSRTFSDGFSDNTSALNQTHIKSETLVMSYKKSDDKSPALDAHESTVIVSSPVNPTLENGTPLSLKTSAQSQNFMADSDTSVPVVMTVSASSPLENLPSKSFKAFDSVETEPLDTTFQNMSRSSPRYSNHFRNQENILSSQSHEEDMTNMRSKQEAKKSASSREPVPSTVKKNAFTNGRFNLDNTVESVTDVVQEKTSPLPQMDTERKPVYYGEVTKPRIAARTFYHENDKKENEVQAKSYSASVNSSDFGNPANVQTKRSFSPREAFRSKAIIKPAIIEKDLKVVMGGNVIEANSERFKTPKTGTNKMTSSITIYPSEPFTARTNMNLTTKERLTSTSNILLTPNDSTSISNCVGSTYDISINKSEITLLLPTDSVNIKNCLDTSVSENIIAVSSPDKTENNNNDSPSETISWKSHSSVDLDLSGEAKMHDPVKSQGRSRHGLSPVDEFNIKMNRNSCADARSRLETLLEKDTRAARIRSRDQYTRRTSAVINSLNTPPDLGSRRSKSNLSASELVTRRSYGNDSSVSSGSTSWNRIPPQDDSTDVNFRARRKLSGSDRLSRTDLGEKRQSAKLEIQQDQQHMGSKIQERPRYRKYYSEEK